MHISFDNLNGRTEFANILSGIYIIYGIWGAAPGHAVKKGPQKAL